MRSADTRSSGQCSSAGSRFLPAPARSFFPITKNTTGAGIRGGLKGENIPIGGRIFAVADVFDALTTERPYRAAVSYREAADLIAKESGTHFDPEVVDAF